MKIIPTHLPDLLLLEPKVFRDDRGYFFESFNTQTLQTAGLTATFVQDNESCSSKNVLRGLHFQRPPFAQGKLVRVIQGAILDVAVDLRTNSTTYGQWEAIELNSQTKQLFWIPPGFAHGFLTLTDNTIFGYKCTHFYNRASEGSIRWDDPDLNIQWGLNNPLLSEKDQTAPLFRDFISPF